MTFEVKLRKVGNSVGILLPRAALDHLGAGSRDTLFVTPMPEGALRLSAFDPEFAQKVKAAELSMEQYVSTLQWFFSREPKPAVPSVPSTQEHGSQGQR